MNGAAARPASSDPPEPAPNCPRCARLANFRDANAALHPSYFNGAVPSFGNESAQLLIVGLAPGLHGANRTGRPFTGDYAGDLLYRTMLKFGFAKGVYAARPDDSLVLVDAMITNAVRCVPPMNKPTAQEVRTCNAFLAARFAALPHLRVVLCLGRIAHDATLAAMGVKVRDAPFAHGAAHLGPLGIRIIDSYHCSRYNTNTGRLTAAMFETVFAAIRSRLSGADT